MTNVAEELPFAAAVESDKLDMVCSNCFTRRYMFFDPEVVLRRCTGCRIVHYCREECQKEDWKFHKDECKFLRRSKGCPTMIARLICRIIMRERRGDLPVAFNGRTFNDLRDNLCGANELTERDCLLLEIELNRFMGTTHAPPIHMVYYFYKKCRMNGYAIRDSIHDLDTLGQAIYIGLTAHKHNCRPNSDLHFIGTKVVLRARDPSAQYSTDLTNSYYPPLVPRQCRQQMLHDFYGIDCQCERCTDEEEALLERSGKSSCCPDGAVLPRQSDHPLICNKCKKESTLTLEQIDFANEKLVRFCDGEGKKALANPITRVEVEALIKLFNNMECLLSPYNLYFSNLAAYLRTVCLRVEITDSVLAMRLVKAQEKSVERYAPFGYAKVMREQELFVMEQCDMLRATRVDISVEQMDGIVVSLGKFHVILKECFGSEHPLTKQIGGNLDIWRRNSHMARRLPLDNNAKKRLIAQYQLMSMKYG